MFPYWQSPNLGEEHDVERKHHHQAGSNALKNIRLVLILNAVIIWHSK